MSDEIISLLQRASADLQAGRLADAETVYRQVLAREPQHADAVHFLGVCLMQSGRPDEGLPLLARSIELAPEHSLYRHNRALMFAQTGGLDAAEKEFDAAIALDAGNAMSHGYLGMIRQQLGRLADAAAAYRTALDIAPDNPFIANNYGKCLIESGDIETATIWLKRSIAIEPRNPVAHNNLGTALDAAGDAQGSIASYRQAIDADPAYVPAWYNLGLALRGIADRQGAFDALRHAVNAGPGFTPAWQEFAAEFSGMRFTSWDAQAAQELIRILQHPAIDAGPLADAAASLLALDPQFAPLFLELSSRSESTALAVAQVQAFSHPLLMALIENATVPEPRFERFLRALRTGLLDAWRRRALPAATQTNELLCAFAQQCFLNEYVWPESADEAAGVAQLFEFARSGMTPTEAALLAAYRPLAKIAGLVRPTGGSEAFARLWRRQVEEPAEEIRLRADIPALTPIDDAVSRRVREQYEQNPYPRWHRAPATVAAPLRKRLRTLFPHLDASLLSIPESPEILIAGCGTGFHAAITATLTPTARVTAIDLSLASLAYALRRCRELGIANVRFAQADILRLGNEAARFDLIESAGVLHHLRDPLEGWRALLSLLIPGGLMKIALYSEIARQGVVAARELIARHGSGGNFGDGLAAIREARQRVFAEPEDSLARQVTSSPDFYTASGARDLVMHVQEHRFTTASLRESLAALDLEFLGFEFSDPEIPFNYRKSFPDDAAAVSLENWGRFETANPTIFAEMYQFWTRKPG